MLPGLSEVSLTANMPHWLLTASTNSIQELSYQVTWSDLYPSNLTWAMTNPETRILHLTTLPVSQNTTKLKEEAKNLLKYQQTLVVKVYLQRTRFGS